jgi:hypothetical protein
MNPTLTSIKDSCMAATEPLCRLLGINCRKLTREEFLILEAELFFLICTELKEYFRKDYENYFLIAKFTKEMELEMLDSNFTKLVIRDILLSGHYTVEGFANYSGFHEDVILEVMSGCNTNPSAILLQKAIALHRTIRNGFYKSIVQRILSEHTGIDA